MTHLLWLENGAGGERIQVANQLVIPAHTAGLERMFKGLKQMKSKAQNRFGKARTKKLVMIMNFIDKLEIDLNEIVRIYKTL